MILEDYGWNRIFEENWKKHNTANLFPGRVITDFGNILKVITENGEIIVDKIMQKLEDELVGVGDWLALEYDEKNKVYHIRFILPRMTKFSRRAAGPIPKEQIVASNVDVVFLMQSLNKDFNMNRLERYLVVAWESGALPVVILTKKDCCTDYDAKKTIVENIAIGVDIYAISCVTLEGMEDIKKYIQKGKTIAFLGSSGVGKSTLLNTLVGKEILKTQEIREDDDKGRHTTTHREIVLLEEGGLIIDTPGMRTMGFWDAETGMDIMFGDVEEITKNCRFFDCTHRTEPGCAVKEALSNGKLSREKWDSWQKLQKEIIFLEKKNKRKEKTKIKSK